MQVTVREQARDFHDRAIAAIREGHHSGFGLAVSAVAMDPNFAYCWYLLGHTCAENRRHLAAIAYFRRALQCEKGDLLGDLDDTLIHKCWLHMGHQLYHVGELDASIEASKKAIQLNPLDGNAFLDLSIVLSIQGKDAEALKAAEEGFKLSPSPTSQLGLAFAQLFLGYYAEGLKTFQCRYPYKLQQFLRFPYPMWQGEKCETLLVCSDQGMGDTLSFLRFIPHALKRCERIVLSAHPELRRIAGEMFWQYGDRVEFQPLPLVFPHAEYWAGVMDVPVALGLKDHEIVSAPTPPFMIHHHHPIWKEPTAKFHVGIAWAGNPDNDIDMWRSLPVTDFLAIADIPGVQLYSLQVGAKAADLHAHGLAGLIRDLSPQIRDAMDTCGIMQHLDMVVTVEGFHHHLASAVDKECHVLLSRNGGDWRCKRHGSNPLWYPNTWLHRENGETPNHRDWHWSWMDIRHQIEWAMRERENQECPSTPPSTPQSDGEFMLLTEGRTLPSPETADHDPGLKTSKPTTKPENEPIC